MYRFSVPGGKGKKEGEKGKKRGKARNGLSFVLDVTFFCCCLHYSVLLLFIIALKSEVLNA